MPAARHDPVHPGYGWRANVSEYVAKRAEKQGLCDLEAAAAVDDAVATGPASRLDDPAPNSGGRSRRPLSRRRRRPYSLTTNVSGSISRYSRPSGGLLEMVMIRVPGG